VAVADESAGTSRRQDLPQIDSRLLELLVCPVTRAALEFNSERQELVSRKAMLAFPIRDGVPIMLHDEARKLLD
jgi:uncharacterized protein YbaR (Trm112 family)